MKLLKGLFKVIKSLKQRKQVDQYSRGYVKCSSNIGSMVDGRDGCGELLLKININVKLDRNIYNQAFGLFIQVQH